MFRHAELLQFSNIKIKNILTDAAANIFKFMLHQTHSLNLIFHVLSNLATETQISDSAAEVLKLSKFTMSHQIQLLSL